MLDRKYLGTLRLIHLICSIWQIIFEGVYALHPDIREALDLWIAVVRIIFFDLFSFCLIIWLYSFL